MAIEIRSLAHTPFEALAEAFGEAFATYDVQINSDELRTMLRRRGFDPALSFAAFDGGKIASFTLNGIGIFGGVPTAYDTGTGTLPEYRGRGLATKVFEASLPHLRGAGVGQYLLEVLQHNTAAVSIYRKSGFEVSREFDYFRAATGDVRCDAPSCAEYNIRPLEPAALGETAHDFWDFEPSWQNNFEAIGRAPDDFAAFGAFDGGEMVGYIVFEPAAGDITGIAVSPPHRRRGIGSALLAEMLRLNRAQGVKCINTERGRDASIAGFLAAKNIPLAGMQFEMVKKLR